MDNEVVKKNMLVYVEHIKEKLITLGVQLLTPT